MRNHASKNLLTLRIFTILFLQFIVFHSLAQQTAALEWVTTIGGSQGDDYADDIALDANGNIFTLGRYYRTDTDMDPGPGQFFLANSPNGGPFLAKSDNNGNFLWAKDFLSHSIGDFRPYTLAIDANGAVIVAGEFTGTIDFDPGSGVFELTSLGYDDVAFCKLDNNGNFVWAKALGSPSNDEQPRDIQVDATGNIYMSGSHRGGLDFDTGPGTFTTPIPVGAVGTFYTKYDPNGNFIWARTIHYPALSGYTQWPGGDEIALDAAGNVYSVGAFRQTMDFDPGAGVYNLTASGGNEEDAYVMKLDNNGNFAWARSFGNVTDQFGDAIGLDGLGGVYVSGRYGGLAVDFDPGPGDATLSGDHIFLSKFDVNGNFVWAKSFGGFQQLIPLLNIDSDANIYISNTVRGTAVDFDPGPGVYPVTLPGNDPYLLKLTKDGNFVWMVSYGSPTHTDTPFGVALDPAGNIYTHGFFGATADFDPSACAYNKTTNGYFDMYTLKLRQTTIVSAPTITSFSPGSGPAGTTVTITGTNFSTMPAGNVVKFFNNRTATVTAASATSLTVAVPAGTVTGRITVTTNCMTATSATDYVVGAAVGPTITSFTPTSGLVGASVTITGTNFSTTPANNIVKLNGTTATVSASTATTITITIPVGATTGKFTVTVGANTATSANNFTVTQPGSGNNEPPQITPTPVTVEANGFVEVSLGAMITDPDGNQDLSSLFVSSDPISGAPATINNAVLTIDYSSSDFNGIDRLSITVCDAEGECTEEELTILVGSQEVGDFFVYNAVSPNGDGKNDILYLQSVDVAEDLKENEVTIYNRWGDVVFETSNYNNTTNVFKGVGKNGGELPSGTYYYKISFPNANKSVAGYISLKR